MGQVSPYFPNPDGFGVSEYPLPAGSNISQLHMLARHGSRYPTGDSGVAKFSTSLVQAVKNGSASFSGELAFLNNWEYGLGSEILVPVGRQEYARSRPSSLTLANILQTVRLRCPSLLRLRPPLQHQHQDHRPDHHPRPYAQICRILHGRFLRPRMDQQRHP